MEQLAGFTEMFAWVWEAGLWLVDFVLQFDKHLDSFTSQYGTWTYLLLVAIIFAETAFVVTPILPGDSLLFAAGALSARGSLQLSTLLVILILAAVAGDAVNYRIGRYLGPKVLSGRFRFAKKEYLDRTTQFYDRFGGSTIIVARCVPIVRTFAPFLAGVGSMKYSRFAVYNVTGAILWVGACVVGGYIFGNLPFVKENFSLVIIAIVFISLLPGLVTLWQKK